MKKMMPRKIPDDEEQVLIETADALGVEPGIARGHAIIFED